MDIHQKVTANLKKIFPEDEFCVVEEKWPFPAKIAGKIYYGPYKAPFLTFISADDSKDSVCQKIVRPIGADGTAPSDQELSWRLSKLRELDQTEIWESLKQKLNLPDPEETSGLKALELRRKVWDLYLKKLQPCEEQLSEEKEAIERKREFFEKLYKVADKPANLNWAVGDTRDDYLIVSYLRGYYRFLQPRHLQPVIEVQGDDVIFKGYKDPYPQGEYHHCADQGRIPRALRARKPSEYLRLVPDVLERYKHRLENDVEGQTIAEFDLIVDALKAQQTRHQRAVERLGEEPPSSFEP